MTDVSVIGAKDSHDTLRAIIGKSKPCTILDVPAGRGGLALFLKQRGWEVHCADIDTRLFGATNIPISEANLNGRLPFNDSSFDAISCVNGIHRVLFPDHTISEFFRVLRPGGVLYLNFNNYSSIVKRLRFLCSGSLEEKITVPSCEQTIGEREAHVRNPLMYPRIAVILKEAGFEIEAVKPAAVRLRHRLLSPVAWTIKVAMRLLPEQTRRNLRISDGNANGVFPGGLYLLVIARKPGIQHTPPRTSQQTVG